MPTLLEKTDGWWTKQKSAASRRISARAASPALLEPSRERQPELPPARPGQCLKPDLTGFTRLTRSPIQVSPVIPSEACHLDLIIGMTAPTWLATGKAFASNFGCRVVRHLEDGWLWHQWPSTAMGL